MRQLDQLAVMAQRLLAQEGSTSTLYFVDEDGGGYDPDTGTSTNSAAVAASCKTIFLDLIQMDRGDGSYSKELLEKSDKEVYLSPQPVTGTYPRSPNAIGDYLVDSEGVKWRVTFVKTYNPSGANVILYKLLVKR
jgi:hypothetical protein